MTLVVDNIGELVTNDPSLGDGPLGVARDASVVIDDGRVVAVGPAGAVADTALDVRGRCVLPGFVDSHTHLVFAGDRSEEFTSRMSGTPYDGGGIRSRPTPRGRPARPRCAMAPRAAARGPSSRHDDGRDQDRVRPVGRLRGRVGRDRLRAHHRVDLPRRAPRAREFEGRADDYVELVCGEMLDAVRPHVAWVDAFCETGAFDADQCRAVLDAGRAAGLGLRLHANQLGYGPGVQLGVELGCASVDHCTYLTDDDLAALAGARPSRRSCRRPTSRPASRIPTRAGRSTPASRWRSPRTAIPARATRPRCRSASRSRCATCT